jgi:Putative transposase DNA-binding domain.
MSRTVKQLKGEAPHVKIARSVKFDADCYQVVEYKGRQYLKLMSLERGKRITIPLLGYVKIEGTLTVVLSGGKAEGFRHEQVNPAYGSQTCIRCGFVDAGNRNGDRFKCLHCGLAACKACSLQGMRIMRIGWPQ